MGSSVHGILQAGILEWVAISSSGGLPNPGIEPESPVSPALAGGFFTTSATWEVHQGSRVFQILDAIAILQQYAALWK